MVVAAINGEWWLLCLRICKEMHELAPGLSHCFMIKAIAKLLLQTMPAPSANPDPDGTQYIEDMQDTR